MKQPKKLLDDLLQDDTSPRFYPTLMEKTLRSARQRKRRRHLASVLGAIALVGIVPLVFYETREPLVSLNQPSQPIVDVPAVSSSNAVQMVSTTPSSRLTVVQTSKTEMPREINDQQLIALVGDRPVALVRRQPGRTELIFIDSGKGFSGR